MRKTPKLGQHFLTGRWAARKLAEAVAVRAGETILEIGPGTGALTRELLRTGAPVIAIEKDAALVARSRETFSDDVASGRLRIIEGDVRDFNPESMGLKPGTYVLAANIPYYITGEIIRRFLESDAQPRAMALLIQKEVAERILARNAKGSILSVSVRAYGHPSLVAKVSRGNFAPPPKVDSAILLVDDISKAFFDEVREDEFFALVRAGFSSKRKFLANNLASRFGRARASEALSSCGVDEKARAEDLAIAQWKNLARTLSTRGRGS